MDINNTIMTLFNIAKPYIEKGYAAVKPLVSSRRFAALMLALTTFAMATMVSVNARAVTVTDGDKSHMVLTMHTDPHKALEAAGVTIAEHDELEVSEDAATITVNRAMTVEVKADGTSTLLYMTDGTVADALAKAEITVGQYDSMNVAMTDEISEGLSIVIDRVAYREYTVTETIPFETVTNWTNVLKPGKVVVKQAGATGSKTLTYRETIVNGQVVETTMVSEQVTKAAVNKIILQGSAYGTPLSAVPGGIQLDANNQPINYKTVYTAKSCTAYATGKRGASGMRLGVGTVAVNPNIIPYGTKLWITSADGKFVYGYAIAADTGSFANGTKTFADLYFGSYKEACYFGRRNLNIYVIG